MYIAFGTLYNRYVLHLHGIDQIPQFSVASMRYHAHEALDWARDIASGMHESVRNMGANSGFLHRPDSNADSEMGLGRGRRPLRSSTNPVSHQSQNLTYGGKSSTGSGGRSVFVRPPSRASSGPGSSQRGEINPISHQAQSQMNHGEPSLSPPQPGLVKREKPGSHPFEETAGSTKEEQEFMLGDEEGEEGDDVGMVFSRPMPAIAPQRLNPVVVSASGPGGDSAVATRGRDTGGDASGL